jgi:hypothetical protein
MAAEAKFDQGKRGDTFGGPVFHVVSLSFHCGIGPKQTSRKVHFMSALEGDSGRRLCNRRYPLMTQFGPAPNAQKS